MMLTGPLIWMTVVLPSVSMYSLVQILSPGNPRNNLLSRSSTEAEYRSLALLVAEFTWISSLLTEL